jgi:hypothetical protein
VWMQKRHGDRGYDAPDAAKAGEASGVDRKM